MRSIQLSIVFAFLFISAATQAVAQQSEGFDYPIGDRGINSENAPYELPEDILEEKNDLYPDHPQEGRTRESDGNDDLWRNAQDVGAYNSKQGGIHSGEDWNWGSPVDDSIEVGRGSDAWTARPGLRTLTSPLWRGRGLMTVSGR